MRRFDDIVLVHPQDITDKKVEIRQGDTLANLPYHPGCSRWFDHHLLTESNEKPPHDFVGLYREAPSAAELVWEYFGSDPRYQPMVEETNRFDSAQLTESDVLQPRGLGAARLHGRSPLRPSGSRRVLPALPRLDERTESIEEVLVEPEVRERIIHMFEQNEEFCWELMQRSRLVQATWSSRTFAAWPIRSSATAS